MYTSTRKWTITISIIGRPLNRERTTKVWERISNGPTSNMIPRRKFGLWERNTGTNHRLKHFKWRRLTFLYSQWMKNAQTVCRIRIYFCQKIWTIRLLLRWMIWWWQMRMSAFIKCANFKKIVPLRDESIDERPSKIANFAYPIYSKYYIKIW